MLTTLHLKMQLYFMVLCNLYYELSLLYKSLYKYSVHIYHFFGWHMLKSLELLTVRICHFMGAELLEWVVGGILI